MKVISDINAVAARLATSIDLRGKDARPLESLSLRARFARGVFWSLLGAVLTRALTFVSGIIAARIIGVEGYGQVGMVQNTVGMFGVFAGFGLGLTATKFVAQYRATAPERAGKVIGLTLAASAISSTLLFAALLILAPWLACSVLHAPEMVPLLRIGSALMLLNALNGVQTGALAGMEDYRSILWRGMLAGLASLPLTLVLAWMYGTSGAVLALVASSLLAWLLTGHALRNRARKAKIQITTRGASGEIGQLLAFSLPAALTGMINMPATWLSAAIIVNASGGFRELGLYNAAYQLAAAAIYLQRYAAVPLVPIISSRKKTTLRTKIKLIAMYMVPTIILVALAATFSGYLAAAFGSRFTGLQPVILLILVAVVPMMAENVLSRMLQAGGRTAVVATISGGKGIVLVAMSYWLCANGATGLASALIVSMTLSAGALALAALKNGEHGNG